MDKHCYLTCVRKEGKYMLQMVEDVQMVTFEALKDILDRIFKGSSLDGLHTMVLNMT